MDPTNNKAFEMMTAAADKSAVHIDAVKPPDKKYGTEGLHMTLSGAGYLPMPFGPVADGADALLYIVEGKKGDAWIAGLSALPGGSLYFGTSKVLYRGIEKTSHVYKSFKKVGSEYLGDVKKKVFQTENNLIKDFSDKFLNEFSLVGSGKHTAKWKKRGKVTYTTTDPVEAAHEYGPKVFRIEIDEGILKDLKYHDQLWQISAKGSSKSGLENASHYIFKRGIKLNRIDDLRLFQTYDDYVRYMVSSGKMSPLQASKMYTRFFSQ